MGSSAKQQSHGVPCVATVLLSAGFTMCVAVPAHLSPLSSYLMLACNALTTSHSSTLRRSLLPPPSFFLFSLFCLFTAFPFPSFFHFFPFKKGLFLGFIFSF